jgi:predicted nucleic acid-binding protein
MRAFDTNILIYACDGRDATRQTAAIALLTDPAPGVILWQVACEFLNASRKLADQGLIAEVAWERLERMLAVHPLCLPSMR